MHSILTRAAIAAVLLLAVVPAATAGRWTPGTSYFIGEPNIDAALETTFDHVACTGVPRLGHTSLYGNDLYIYFDCTTKLNGKVCRDARYRSVKAAKQGYFVPKLVRKPTSCA